MKRLINLILILGIIISLPSCSEEFFDKEPPGTAAGSVMQNEKGVESLLIGAYSKLRGHEFVWGAIATDWVYGEAASDNCYKGSQVGDQPEFNLVEKYQCLPSTRYMELRWSDCFCGVGRANEVLEILKLT